MPAERIPIFPLELVLLPEAALPLRIFEPRYREMIRLCLGTRIEFGVVQQHEHGIAAIGCTAEIAEVLKEYEDGRMDILAVGRRPFRVLHVTEEKAYYQADVEFLANEPGHSPEVQARLLAKYAELHQVLFAQPPPELDPDDVFSVAYAAAAELPLDAGARQLLLEVRGERERQRILLDRIEEWIPTATHQQRVKKSAGGNGHGLR